MMRTSVACAVMAASLPAAAATVRSARVSIVLSPGACEVTSRLVVDTADPIVLEHRVMLPGGREVPTFVVIGGLAGEPDTAGRTVRLPISLTGLGRNEYTVRYRIAAPAGPPERCPLLVPFVPTDGVTRAVSIEVEVPAGATRLPGEFPAFTWSGQRGTVVVGHLPSFVRVPYAPRGVAIGWRDTLDARRVIDALALVVIAMSTAAWVALRRRRG
jgi:hypothetical protein